MCLFIIHTIDFSILCVLVVSHGWAPRNRSCLYFFLNYTLHFKLRSDDNQKHGMGKKNPSRCGKGQTSPAGLASINPTLFHYAALLTMFLQQQKLAFCQHALKAGWDRSTLTPLLPRDSLPSSHNISSWETHSYRLVIENSKTLNLAKHRFLAPLVYTESHLSCPAGDGSNRTCTLKRICAPQCYTSCPCWKRKGMPKKVSFQSLFLSSRLPWFL